eukprot:210726-Amphidinium_carterae.2
MALPYVLSTGMIAMVGWIPSECNPADDPTRHVCLRQAQCVSSQLAQLLSTVEEREPWPWHATKKNWERKGWSTGEHSIAAVCLDDTEQTEYDDTLGFPGEGPRMAVGHVSVEADLSVTVQPATLQRYEACLTRLRHWMASEGLGPLESLLEHKDALNGVLRAFIQHLHDHASPVSWGAETLAAIQSLAPRVRGHLGPAWLMQRQFARTRPLMMRPPIPIELLLALVLVMWTQHQYRSAVALLVGYHCLLRPAELCRLRRQDLLLSCDTSGAEWSGVITIGQSKTTARSARLQSVVVLDAPLLRLLTWLVGSDHPSRLLVPGGLVRLNQVFNFSRQLLRIPAGQFTLGGLRAGGAVDFLRATHDPHSLQYRGRWESTRSMYHYMQVGAGMATYARLSQETQTCIRALANLAPTVLNLAVMMDRPTALSLRPNEDQGSCTHCQCSADE